MITIGVETAIDVNSMYTGFTYIKRTAGSQEKQQNRDLRGKLG